MANCVDPDLTDSIGAVRSGSSLFASILNSSVMLGKYLQQTTSADDIFRCFFFLSLYGLINKFAFRFSLFNFRSPFVFRYSASYIFQAIMLKNLVLHAAKSPNEKKVGHMGAKTGEKGLHQHDSYLKNAYHT